MVFRLPSQLESLVPPPMEQRPQPGPWRGSIVVTGMRASDRSFSQEIFVTAVETEGEKAQLWPRSFFFQVLHERPVLREFQTWLRSSAPTLPLCTFMANRLRDPDHNVVNQTNFRSLSHALSENGLIAFAHWGTGPFASGPGIIIYPAQNSSAVLVGALFFQGTFPEGLGLPHPPMSPSSMQASGHPMYHQPRLTSPYSSNRHAHSLSPHGSDPHSPIEQQAIPGHTRDYHRYNMMHAPGPSNYPNMHQPLPMPSEHNWPNIKAEDENRYAPFSPTSHETPPFS